jgi:hypothetical protein
MKAFDVNSHLKALLVYTRKYSQSFPDDLLFFSNSLRWPDFSFAVEMSIIS